MLELVNNSLTWSSFDLSKKPMNSAQIKVLLRNIPNALAIFTEFKVCGLVDPSISPSKSRITVTPNILTTLKEKCPLLEAIEIHRGYLDFRKVGLKQHHVAWIFRWYFFVFSFQFWQIQLTHFPSTLRRLNLIECCTIAPRSTRLFTHIDEAMPLLEELSLEKCSWFETHDLVVFSKLPQLKRLILRGCMSLRSCVPYGSIACRFGFPKLEVKCLFRPIFFKSNRIFIFYYTQLVSGCSWYTNMWQWHTMLQYNTNTTRNSYGLSRTYARNSSRQIW